MLGLHQSHTQRFSFMQIYILNANKSVLFKFLFDVLCLCKICGCPNRDELFAIVDVFNIVFFLFLLGFCFVLFSPTIYAHLKKVCERNTEESTFYNVQVNVSHLGTAFVDL